MKPKTRTPPKTPTTISNSGRLEVREIRIGLTKLSTLLALGQVLIREWLDHVDYGEPSI